MPLNISFQSKVNFDSNSGGVISGLLHVWSLKNPLGFFSLTTMPKNITFLFLQQQVPWIPSGANFKDGAPEAVFFLIFDC